jgi:CRP-like cAMP-binding protein/rhodanese-related sulfurtransferase
MALDVKANKGKKEKFARGKIFEKLPRDKWDELTRAAEHRVVAPHTIIFRQGDPGDKFYIIRSGKVRVFKRGSDGFETDLSVLGAGESFGQMPLLTDEARSTNVEAMEETHLLVLSKEQFERVLKDFPDISLVFVKQMSRLLMRADRVIEKEALQQRRAPRIAWFHFVLVIGVSVLLALVFNQSNPNGIPLFPKSPDRKAISEISAAQAMEEMKQGDALIVDAGPEGFYQKKHIQGAISVPLSLFDILYEVKFGEEEKAKKVIVYGGIISKFYDWELANKLLLKGHKDVKVLEGGMAAWEKAGYPLEIWEEKK